MGNIRDKQLELLQTTGEELITYKVYDKDGSYIETFNENVLLEAPTVLRPIDNSMTTEYLRPLKRVTVQIPLKERNFTTEDPTFKYGGYRWVLDSNVNVVSNTSLATNINSNIKGKRSLTGDYCLLDNNSAFKMEAPTAVKIRDNLVQSVKTDWDYGKVSSSNDFEVGFSYYVGNDNDTADYYFATVVRVIKNDESGQYYFHYGNNQWEDFSSVSPDTAELPYLHFSDRVKNTKCNQWNNYSKVFPPIDDENNFENKIEFLIYSIAYNTVDDTNDHQAVLYDNIYVANHLEYGDNVIAERTQSSSRTITGLYEVENVPISNELNNTVYDNGIAGSFYSRHDGTSNGGSLEELITQEYINDYRNFLIKYEGSFYNNNPLPIPVSMHNKIWFNFIYGSGDNYIDPCSCYIDSMEYDIKANQYSVTLHLPNQDDNVASDFRITYD